jgi:hypothetical protein
MAVRSVAAGVPAPTPISPQDLYLDHENPRLVEEIGPSRSQDEIIRHIWKQFDAAEIALSIAHNGFFKHEPLYAIREGRRLVVIEGNRRLAAVKILLDRELQGRLDIRDSPSTSSRIASDLSTLPVIVTTRRDVWQFIGVKHVNGPSVWRSEAKAEYVRRVHDHWVKRIRDAAGASA